MTIRPKGRDPHRVTVILRGRPGAWRTYPLGSSGPGVATAGNLERPAGGEVERVYTRQGDTLPNPQAFSIPLIQAYPTRTATCRQCPELRLKTCARACCAKLQASHAALLNAVQGGACPLNRFTEEL